MKKLISFLFIAFLLPSFTLAQTTPEGEQLSLDFGPEFSSTPSLNKLKLQIQNTYSTILNRHSTTLDRNEAVNALFADIETLCTQNCEFLVKNLQDFNSRFSYHSASNRESIANFIQGVINRPPTSEELEKGLSLVAFTQKLESMYKKDPESFQEKLQASIQAVKSVVGFEQEAIFKALSQNPDEKGEGLTDLKTDLAYMIGQGKALTQVAMVFKNHDKQAEWTEEEARQIATAVNDLGIFYIKLAQSVSNLADVMPEQILKALKVFQDQLPPLEPQTAEEILRQELGRDPHEIFIDLDLSKPANSGSIAVVYEAKVKNIFGQLKPVMIKVQRPGLQEVLNYNRRLNRMMMQFLRVSGSQLTPVLDFLSDQIIGLEDAFEGELDFRKEMRNAQRFARFFRFNKNIQVPAIYSQYSTRKILVMEKADGINLEKAIAPTAKQFQEKRDKFLIENTRPYDPQNPTADLVLPNFPEQVSLEESYSTIFEAMSYMLVVTHELHADLHPGNILAVLEQENEDLKISPQMTMLDFGQTVKTKGFIFTPLMAGYHLLMGNPEGFTKRLLQMSKDPNFPAAPLLAAVKKAFDDYGIHRVQLTTLVQGKSQVNMGDNTSKALAQILRTAFKDLGYRSNPRYIQVARSLAPIAGTLILIGRNIDPMKLARLSIIAFGRGVGLGTLYYLSAVFPNTFGDLKNAVEDAVDKYRQDLKARQASRQPVVVHGGRCEAIFSQ